MGRFGGFSLVWILRIRSVLTLSESLMGLGIQDAYPKYCGGVRSTAEVLAGLRSKSELLSLKYWKHSILETRTCFPESTAGTQSFRGSLLHTFQPYGAYTPHFVGYNRCKAV